MPFRIRYSSSFLVSFFLTKNALFLTSLCPLTRIALTTHGWQETHFRAFRFPLVSPLTLLVVALCENVRSITVRFPRWLVDLPFLSVTFSSVELTISCRPSRRARYHVRGCSTTSRWWDRPCCRVPELSVLSCCSSPTLCFQHLETRGLRQIWGRYAKNTR